MRVISVNVGQPRTVTWRAQSVATSIWKHPVAGAVFVAGVNLAGDDQADRRVHGGTAKAVYAYPTEHYAYWRSQLPDAELPWGAFGENLSVEGLLETNVGVGDRYRIGSAEFVVTQPRSPCFKLGIRFGRDDMVKRFLASRRSGFYLAIAREGQLEAGDAIHQISRDDEAITIAQIVGIVAGDIVDPDLARRAIANPTLPKFWKEQLSVTWR